MWLQEKGGVEKMPLEVVEEQLRASEFDVRTRHHQNSILRMGQKTYFAVVGIIFALVALAHAVRIYMEWPVIIGDWSVPKSVSWVALVVAGGLALFAFRFAANSR